MVILGRRNYNRNDIRMVTFLKRIFYKYWIAPWAGLMLLIAPLAYAGDNHVHIDQPTNGSADNVEINIEQLGYGNLIKFSVDHQNNTFNLSQKNGNNTISWVPWWGSGKSWGGDVDGRNNTIDIDQEGSSTYGAHVWGNYNDVDVYQSGEASDKHEVYLDIHANYTETDIWQEGQGDKYARLYYYGSTSNSDVDITQKGSGSHTALIQLQGSYLSNLTLLQQGATDQSYSLTQTCVTVGGCTLSVTQGN